MKHIPEIVAGLIFVLACPRYVEARAIAQNGAQSISSPFVLLDTQKDTPRGVFIRIEDTGGRKFIYPEKYSVETWSTGAGAVTNKPSSVHDFALTDPQFPTGCWLSPSGRYAIMDMTRSGLSDEFSHEFFIWDTLQSRLMLGAGGPLHYKKIIWSPNSDKFLYFVGGDSAGEESENTSAIWLSSFYLHKDPSTPRAFYLAHHMYATRSAWDGEDSVLYTAIPENLISSPIDAHQYFDTRCGIYKVQPNGKANSGVLVCDRACDPVPSPDGKWLACFGWPELSGADGEPPAGSKEDTRRLGLYIFDRSTKKRTLLHPINPIYDADTLSWTSDSKELVDVTSSHSKAEILVISLPTMHTRVVTSLTAHDSIIRQDPIGQFVAKGISKDGKWLFVLVNEYGNESRDSWTGYDMYQSLIGVQLANGTTRVLWKTKNVQSADWRQVTSPR